MYLTAHRVRAPSSDVTGINVFLHTHGGGGPFAAGHTGEALLEDVTHRHPGELSREDLQVPPGGNTVLSYLDLVAPDGTPREALDRALDALQGDLRESAHTAHRAIHEAPGPIATCFGASRGLTPKGLNKEYATLRAALAPFLP